MNSRAERRGCIAHRGPTLGIILSLATGTVPVAASEPVSGGAGAGPNAVMPIEAVLARVRESYAGHVLEVELERDEKTDSSGWVYEVKVLTDDGRVLKLEYDAKTLELIEMKGRYGDEVDDD